MVTEEKNHISRIPDREKKKRKKKMEHKQKHYVKVYIWQRTCKGAESYEKMKHTYEALNEEWTTVVSFIYEVESVFYHILTSLTDP